MRKVIAVEWMSLDGVIQSAGADDDTTGGFEHGGWHLPYFDDLSQKWVVEGYAQGAASYSAGAPTSFRRATGQTRRRRSRPSRAL
jgi:hypothetical protein